MSGNHRDNRAFIAGENGNNSMVGSAWKSTENLIRDFHFYGPRRSFFLQWHFWLWLKKNVRLNRNSRLWTCVILYSLACWKL